MKTKLKTNCSIVRIVRLFGLRSVIAAALCAVGLSAFAENAAKLPPVKVDALSNAFALDPTAGDRIAQDEETLVVDPAWDETDPTLAKVRIDGEDEPRTYTCASNDLWQTASLEPGRYEAELMTACFSYVAGFWKTGDDWTVFDSSNITADVTFEAGKTYLFFGTNTVDATLTVTDGAKFAYDESAPAGFLGGTVNLPKRYEQKTVEGDLYQIVEKIKGCEGNPWEVGGTDGTDDLVTAWTNGTELVIDGTGTVTNLADIAKGGLTAVKITEATVKGAAKDAFKGVGGESAVKVSLPDGWQGELPDEDGKLYGMKVDMANFVYPMAVKNVKFQQRYPWNGLVDISCDLSGAGYVQIAVSTLQDGKKLCDVKAIEGETTIDLGETGCATNGVKFIWNAAKDLPAGFKGQGIKVKVTVEKQE